MSISLMIFFCIIGSIALGIVIGVALFCTTRRGSISEQNPGVDVASLLGRTLELLRADVLSALQGPGRR